MQFLLGGYSLGQPGLVIEPLSLVRNPPQAAGGTREVASPTRSSRSRKGPKAGQQSGEDGSPVGLQFGGMGQMVGAFAGEPKFKSRMVCIYGHFYYLFRKIQVSAGRDTEGPGNSV